MQEQLRSYGRKYCESLTGEVNSRTTIESKDIEGSNLTPRFATKTRLMGSVFSEDPKPGEASTKQRKTQLPSASNSPHFLAPAQEIRTCGGQLFEPSESQMTKKSTLRRRARRFPLNQGIRGQTENRSTGTSRVDHTTHQITKIHETQK